MTVPVVDVASTSPSPANLPPVIDTVALARLRLYGSVTVSAPESVAVASCSVYCALAATLVRVGGSLTPTTVIVLLALLDAPNGKNFSPSLTIQSIVRVVGEP